MRVPSRRLPKYVPPPMRAWQWFAAALYLLALAAALAYGFAQASALSLAIAGAATLAVGLLGWRQARADRVWMGALANARHGESICNFARSFERRTVDPWVIRAVYEELQAALPSGTPSFPVRAEDQLTRDLRIDPDALDEDLAPVIAARTGRSLDEAASNPYKRTVQTAGDLVLFFNAQPRVHA